MTTRKKRRTDSNLAGYTGPDPNGMDEFFDFTVEELREVISFLIQQREALRDEELRELEQEARKTIAKLHDIDRKKLLEEITCFKDVLSLHKRLVERNGAGRRGETP